MKASDLVFQADSSADSYEVLKALVDKANQESPEKTIRLLVHSEKEYRKQRYANDEAIKQYLDDRSLLSYLSSHDLAWINQKNFHGLRSDANDQFTGQRYCHYLDPDQLGPFALPSHARSRRELEVLDEQMKEMEFSPDRHGHDVAMRNADEVRLLAFQIARFFAIHPFDDANKRTIQAALTHFAISRGHIAADQDLVFAGVPLFTVTQAIFGDNIGPLAKALSCAMHLDQHPDPDKRVNPALFVETEFSRFSVRPRLHEAHTFDPHQLAQVLRYFKYEKATPNPEFFAELDQRFSLPEEATRRDVINAELDHARLRPENAIAAAGAILPACFTRSYRRSRLGVHSPNTLLLQLETAPHLDALADQLITLHHEGILPQHKFFALLRRGSAACAGISSSQSIEAALDHYRESPHISFSEALQMSQELGEIIADPSLLTLAAKKLRNISSSLSEDALSLVPPLAKARPKNLLSLHKNRDKQKTPESQEAAEPEPDGPQISF